MARALFEFDCSRPDVVIAAIDPESISPAVLRPTDKGVTVEVNAEDGKILMKYSYSVCNRVVLAIETVERFKK